MGRNAKLQVEFKLLIDVIDEYENIVLSWNRIGSNANWCEMRAKGDAT
jgi:hypothetical protein